MEWAPNYGIINRFLMKDNCTCQERGGRKKKSKAMNFNEVEEEIGVHRKKAC